MINFVHSKFNRLILHRVLKKLNGEEHSQVKLEDQLIEADEDVQKIIKERLAEACGKQSRSFRLFIDKHSEKSFYGLTHDVHDLNEEDFIQRSKQIAHLLGRSQRRSVNGGYLILIEVESHTGRKAIVAIKAELQKAFATRTDLETNKKQIEVLNDLFLSPNNKFFKIGYIYEEENGDESHPNDKWAAIIFDDQFSVRKAPADYFIADFLGFTLERNAKFMNREYYQKTRKLIESNLHSTVDEKRDSIKALNTVFKDQTQQIDPIEFSQRFLPEVFKEDYAQIILSDKRFDRPFARNTELVKNELNKKIMVFAKKIKIQGPEEDFDDVVQIVNNIQEAEIALNQTDRTLISIEGKPYTDV